MSELDVIGVIHGTDKSSVHSYGWDYLHHYEELFQKWQLEPINIIEIGVRAGSSIDTWLEYFDRATIIGVDIDESCRRFARDRVVIKIGSQDDPAFLEEVVRDHKPTIVIDDGSHLANHMIASFEALFPALAPGGVYIFEDLSFHFKEGVKQWQGAKAHQGVSDKSIYDYLAPFFRARLANVSIPAGASGFSRYAHENIASITAFGSAAVIRKRAPRAYGVDLNFFEQMLASGKNRKIVEQRYILYLIKHNVNLERAYQLLKAGLSETPDDIALMDQLFVVNRRLNQLEEALECAQMAAALRPDLAAWWRRLAETQRLLNNPKGELEALKKLLAIDAGSLDAQRRASVLFEQAGEPDSALAAARKVSDGRLMIPDGDIYRTLAEIFSDVFLRDDIPLSPALTARDVEGWDSFKQIEIVIAMEERFHFKFTSSELDEMQRLGDLVRIVAERGRPRDRVS